MVQKNKYIPSEASTDWIDWCRSLQDLYVTDKYFQKGDTIEKVSNLRMKRWIMAQNFKSSDRVLNFLLLDSMVSSNNSSPGSESYVPHFLFNDKIELLGRFGSAEYLSLVKNLRVSEHAKEVFENVNTKKTNMFLIISLLQFI